MVSLLEGAYQAMDSTSGLYDTMLLLFQFTIGPSISFFGQLEVRRPRPHGSHCAARDRSQGRTAATWPPRPDVVTFERAR
eukprot:3665789-Prymnesium_polylepis.1